MCNSEKNLFYYADGTFSGFDRPRHVPKDCPALIVTCWLCGGKGSITPERDHEFREWEEWRSSRSGRTGSVVGDEPAGGVEATDPDAWM